MDDASYGHRSPEGNRLVARLIAGVVAKALARTEWSNLASSSRSLSKREIINEAPRSHAPERDRRY
jgi:hypothetical protein